MIARLSHANRYMLYGAAFGALFPIGSVLLLLALGALPPTSGLGALIGAAHRGHPLLYVIDTAPLFLGLFARLAGLRQARIAAFSRRLEAEVAEKTASLAQALEEAQHANQTIAHMADHDALTGLLNRRRFEADLLHWVEFATRYERPAALLFIDLDDFKRVNDRLGHGAGDAYLLGVAQVLRKCFRSSDFVARWGGDEFAVLLPETDMQAAGQVAEKLLQRLAATHIALGADARTPSASVGVALIPEHAKSAAELMSCADAAMYEAKEAGGQRWRMYSPSAESTARVQEQGRWEARIRRALETDQFVLLYQPVIDLRTGATRRYEALVRMEDRDGNLVSAGVILEHAQRLKLSAAIDRMVVRKAVRRLASLGAAARDLQISVNLSRSSIDEPEFFAFVANTLHEEGIPGERLAFEISERAAVENLIAVRGLAALSRAQGCELIMDEFGLGFLALPYLDQMGFRTVKISGDLVRQLGREGTERRQVRAIAGMARELGIRTVGKCVERGEDLRMLAAIRVDEAQGFAIGRPLESLEQVLAQPAC